MDDVRDTLSFLAEWYLPDLAEAAVDDIVERLHTAACVLTAAGARVRLMATLSVPTDEVLYGVFDADSSENVVAACERGGIPPQRLSGGVVARLAPHRDHTDHKRLLPESGDPGEETTPRLVAH